MAGQVDVISNQSNIKHNTRDMTRYSLFVGGTNVKSEALAQYDPLVTGRARIFFTKMPRFMEAAMPNATKNFKHILEYGNTAIDGIQDSELGFNKMGGGITNREFDVATFAANNTDRITVRVYEFTGSPIREYCDMWINGIGDHLSGYGNYLGMISAEIPYAAVNHTAEAFVVSTGPVGDENDIEHVYMVANMMPTGSKRAHFNYEKGNIQIVETDIEFTAVVYECPDANVIGKALMKRYKVLRGHLDYKTGYTIADVDNMPDLGIEDWD